MAYTRTDERRSVDIIDSVWDGNGRGCCLKKREEGGVEETGRREFGGTGGRIVGDGGVALAERAAARTVSGLQVDKGGFAELGFLRLAMCRMAQCEV
jgi:hypothetical protein